MFDTDFNEPDKNNCPMLPHTAIILFGKENENTILGATRHNIKNEQMGLGEYINPQELSAFFAKSNANGLTINTPNIVAENEKTLVWYTHSFTKRMWFRVAGSKPTSLEVKWPTLLFVADKNLVRLNIFSLAEDAFPSKESIVYHAPLMNINGSGSVCQGSAKLPDIISKETIQDIESTIFGSNFTHVNHPNTINLNQSKKACDNKAHFAFWRKKAKHKTPVSKDELVQYTTLGDLPCFRINQ
jgi:PRTRC genetic system protein B